MVFNSKSITWYPMGNIPSFCFLGDLHPQFGISKFGHMAKIKKKQTNAQKAANRKAKRERQKNTSGYSSTANK
jgi:hypothetical protein